MFSKPRHGWVAVKIGDFIGEASYVTDFPRDCMEAFTLAMQNKLPVSVGFDEEGSEFLLVLDWNNRVFVIENRSDESSVLHKFEIEHKHLINEFLDDMGKYFEDFIGHDFYSLIEEEDEESQRQELVQRLQRLEGLVEDYRG